MGTMFALAALAAGIAPTLAMLIDLLIGQNRAKSLLAGITSFAVPFVIISITYFYNVPALVGPWWGIATELVISFTFTAVVFGFVTMDGTLSGAYRVVRDRFGHSEDYEPLADKPQPRAPRHQRLWGWFRTLPRRGVSGAKSSGSWFKSSPGKAKNLFHDIPAAFICGTVAVAMFICNLVFVVGMPFGEGQAKELARIVSVTTVTDPSQTPGITPEKLVIVPMQDAINRAKNGYGSYKIPNGYPGAGQNLSAQYDLATTASTVYYEGRRWYLMELLFRDNRSNARMRQTSPGYVMASAENPREPIQVKLGYHIRYMSTHWLTMQVNRKMWKDGYSHYQIDGSAFEIDDQGDPHFVGSLSQPAKLFHGRVPKLAYWMDAQTGVVKTSPLAEAPEWADNVLSAEAVKFMAEEWGQWTFEGKSFWQPWRNARGNRYETVGDPQPVYTDAGYIQWQVLMKSRRSKSSSVTHFLVFDRRALRATLYPANNVADVNRAMEVVQDKLGDKFKPVQPSLVFMYNQLTYVIPYVTNVEEEKQSGAGLALVAANSVADGNVIYDAAAATALFNYHGWLSRSLIAASGKSGRVRTVEGELESVQSTVLQGNEVILVVLKSEPNKPDTKLRFRMLSNSSYYTLEILEMRPGARLSIKFADVGRTIVDADSIDVLGVNQTESVSS